MEKLKKDWSNIILQNKTTPGLPREGIDTLERIVILLVIEKEEIQPDSNLFGLLHKQLNFLSDGEMNVLAYFIQNYSSYVLLALDGAIDGDVPTDILSKLINVTSAAGVIRPLGFLITRRPNSVKKISLKTDAEIHLIGFTDLQIRVYIGKYVNYMRENELGYQGESSELYQMINDAPGIGDFAANPIILQFICLVHGKFGCIGSTILDLLEKYVIFRLKLYDQNDLTDDKFLKSHQHLLCKMGNVAIRELKKGYPCLLFPVQTMTDVSGEVFDTGLVTRNENDGTASFHHRYLQEYLAAYFVKHSSKKEVQEVLKFCATAEHIFSSHTMFGFILAISGKSTCNLVEKHMAEIISRWEPGDEAVSPHELSKFLLTMLRDFKSLKFCLPKRIVVNLKKEKDALVSRFLGQDGSKVKHLQLIPNPAQNFEPLNKFKAPNIESLQLDFIHLSPEMNKLCQHLSKKSHIASKVTTLTLKNANLKVEALRQFLQCIGKTCNQLSFLEFPGSTTSLQGLLVITEFINKPSSKVTVKIYPECTTEGADEELIKICRGKPKWNSCKKIILENRKLTPEGIRILSKVVSFTSQLSQINLGHCKLGDKESFGYLTDSLSQNCHNLTNVNFTDCGLGPTGGAILAQKAGLIAKLHELYLTKSDINVADFFSSITPYLSKKCQLRILDLSENRVGQKGIDKISGFLEYTPKLEKIYLSECGITHKYDTCMQKLIMKLDNTCPNLDVLDLSENLISVGCAYCIAQMQMKLRVLDLAGCQLGNEALTEGKLAVQNIKLARSIRLFGHEKGNPLAGTGAGTEHMETGSCPIPTGGDFSSYHTSAGSTIAAILKNIPDTIEHINISENNVGEAGVNVMKDMLQVTKSLQTLKLANTQIVGKTNISAAIDVLQSQMCQSLKMLDLSGNAVLPQDIVELTKLSLAQPESEIIYPGSFTEDDETFVDICKGKRTRWDSITELDLTGLKLTENGVDALTSMVPHLPHLIRFYLPPKCITSDDVMQNLIEQLSKGEQSYEELLLAENVFGPKSAQQLSKMAYSEERTLPGMVQILSDLKQLFLSDCSIDSGEEMQTLLRNITDHCRKLDFLDLSNNQVVPKVFVLLTILDLGSKNTGQNMEILFPTCSTEDSQELLDICQAKHTSWDEQTELRLSDSIVTSHGAEALAELCPFLCNLKKMYLANLGLCENFVHFGNTLSNEGSAQLEHIDFMGNHLNQGNTPSFKNVLMRNKNLKYLSVEKCHIVDTVTLEMLTDGLAFCNSLQDLNLSGNRISVEGGILVSNLFPATKDLQHLWMANCGLGTALGDISDSLAASCNVLKWLDLTGNEFTDVTLEKFTGMLSCFTQLEKLWLTDCGINKPSSFTAMIKTISEKSEHLQLLYLSGNTATPSIIVCIAKMKYAKYNQSTRESMTSANANLVITYPECGTCDSKDLVDLCKGMDPLSDQKYFDFYQQDFRRVTNDNPSSVSTLGENEAEHATSEAESMNVLPVIQSDITWNSVEEIDLSNDVLIHRDKEELVLSTVMLEPSDTMSNLEEDDLNTNMLWGGTHENTFNSIDVTPAVSVQNILYREITNDGAVALAMVLEETNNLCILNLEGSRIKDADLLCKIVLSVNSEKLKTLNIAYNNLGSSGLLTVSEPLKEKWSLLQNLFLGSTEVDTDIGIDELLKASEDCPDLAVLDLSNNTGSALSIAKLTEATYKRTKVTLAVNYPSCSTSDKNNHQLIDIMKGKPHWKKLQKFNQSNADISGNAVLALCLVLRYSDSLEHFSVPSCKLSSTADINMICDSVFVAAPLRVLNLSCIPLDDTAVSSLANSGDKLALLEYLALANCGITSNSNRRIIKSIGDHCPKLKFLDISKNQVEGEGMEALASVLHKVPKLEGLYLTECQVAEQYMLLVENIKCHNNALKALRLRRNNAPPTVHVALTILSLNSVISGTATKPQQNQRKLSIQYPDCSTNDDANVVALCQGKLCQEGKATIWKETRTINLRDKRLTSDAVLALSQVLPNLPNLEQLLLSDCRIKDEKLMEQCISSLPRGGSFEVLDLSTNHVGPSGGNSLTRFLGDVVPLKVLDLARCKIIDTSITDKIIQTLCVKCRNLVRLNLSENKISVDGLQSLANMLKQAPNIELLSLNNTSIENDQMLQNVVAVVQEKNKLLQDFNLGGNKANVLSLACITELKIKRDRRVKIQYPAPKEDDNQYLTSICKEEPDTWQDITDIDMSNEEIDSLHIKALSKVILFAQDLQAFNIGSCNIKNVHEMESIIKCLSHTMKDLKHIDLSENNIGQASFELTKMVQHQIHLTTLKLNHCKLNDTSGLVQLCKTLEQSCKDLILLQLSGNNAEPPAHVAVSQLVLNTPHNVDVSYPECNTCDDTSILELCQSPKVWSTTTVLDLSGKDITAAGVQAISSMLKHIPAIESISLKKSKMESIVLQEFCRSCLTAESSSLKCLDMSQTSLQCDGARSLIAAIKQGSLEKVTELNLSESQLTDPNIVSKVIDALGTHCTSIETLDLGKCTLRQAGLDSLQRLVLQVKQIKKLLMQNTGIDDSADPLVNSLISGITKNWT